MGIYNEIAREQLLNTQIYDDIQLKEVNPIFLTVLRVLFMIPKGKTILCVQMEQFMFHQCL